MALVRIAQPNDTSERPRLPTWLRAGSTNYQALHDLKVELRERRLHTVCESARCPNIHYCFSHGTATFMIMGNICTRHCGFCSVPQSVPGSLDPKEPAHVADMAARMGLRYVVITSVNRDDLADGGSRHFAETVRHVRSRLPHARVEVLTPDFCGDLSAIARVLDSGPDVFNHNMETVRRLYRRVRPQADYDQSLEVLGFARRRAKNILTKSGLMVGLGEREEEVRQLLTDLRKVGADIATIGQYLQPRKNRLSVAEYVPLSTFSNYRMFGETIGFRAVYSGPLVRSSYMAEMVQGEAVSRKDLG